MTEQKQAVAREVLTVEEVAKILNLGLDRTYRALRADEIPSLRLNGGKYLIPRVALDAFLAAATPKDLTPTGGATA